MSWNEKGGRWPRAMLGTVRVVCGTGGVLAALACGGSDAAPPRDARRTASDSIAVPGTVAQPAATSTNRADAPRSGPPVVLFFGTSLTAGLGLEPEQAYPARVSELAVAADTPIQVVNAGLSGETSAGALRRADWVLGRTPADVIVIETGANDGLRAFEVEAVRANLDSLVAKARAAQPAARLVLVQMEALPNLGPEYARAFRAIYPAIAEKYGIPLVPFLLEGVVGKPELNQADGVHPTAAGARIAAGTVWGTLGPIVREVSASR